MHGPGLFLMILRKGLGLFFERAIPKSARCPKSTDFLEKLGFPSSMDAIASRSDGSYNIVVFLTICISYANNCFTL